MTRGQRVFGASAWSTVDVLGRQATAFIFSIALARILAPADFGAAALAIMCSSILIALLQTGFVTLLASRRESTHEEENAAFWLCVLASGALAAGLVAIAPWIARFFGLPLLQPLVSAAAAQVLFNALGVVQTGLLTRSLAMKRLAVAGLVSGLASGGLSVALALSGGGAMSIVLPLAVNALVNTILLWHLCRWRPALTFQMSALAPYWPFLRNLGASNLLDSAYGNIANALLGKLRGPHELGLYNRANGTQQLPGNIILMAASRVMLPVFADSKAHPERLRQDLASAVRILAAISFPAMAVLAASAGLVIDTLFGPKWLPAAPVLAILAIGGALVPLHAANLQAMLACDRSDTYLRVETTKKVLALAMLSVGAFRGIFGIAVAQAAYSVMAFFINARFAGKMLGYGPLLQLADTVPAAAGAALIAATVLGMESALSLPSPTELLIVLIVAAAMFLALNLNLLRLVRGASRAPSA